MNPDPPVIMTLVGDIIRQVYERGEDTRRLLADLDH
jgi:hypothetical protein